MPVTPQTKILLVEDKRNIRDIARHMIKQAGFNRIDECRDPAEAIQLLQIKRHDLVIANRDMERVSGLALLDRVRKDPRASKTPFIMMAGKTEAEYVQMAVKSGVSDVVAIPFSVLTIRKKIEKALRTNAA